MGGTEPGSAREEAERLVATLLAAARMASAVPRSGQGWGPLGGMLSGVLGHSADSSPPGGTAPWGRTDPGGRGAAGTGGFATGSPECCVCPLCRAITALRDPSPEFAERLATGAGDFAAGMASLLRAFGAPAGEDPDRRDDRQPSSREGSGTPDPVTRPDPADATTPKPNPHHVWREATRTGHDSASAPEHDVWSAATRTGDAAARAAAVPPVDADGSGQPVDHRSPADRPVVPASREPEEGGDAPGDGA